MLCVSHDPPLPLRSAPMTHKGSARKYSPATTALDQALKLLQQGNAAASLSMLANLCHGPDASVQSWLAAARAHAALRQHRAADAALDHAIRLSPPSMQPGIVAHKARWFAASGRQEQALTLLAACSGHPETDLLRGQLSLQLRQYQQAFCAFSDALERVPDSLDAHLGLARSLQALGRRSEALQVLQQAPASCAGHPALVLQMASLLRLEGHIEQALQAVGNALTQHPDDVQLRDLHNGLLADAGDAAAALEGARKLLATRPMHPAGLRTLTHLLWEHGPQLAPACDPLQPLTQALQQQPGNRILRLELVSTLKSMGQTDRALAVLQPLLSDGHDGLAQWYRADILTQTGQLAEADKAYALAQEHIGKHPALLNARARHALMAHQPERAGKLAGQCLQQDADNQEAWALLSVVWRVLDDERYHWLCDYDRLIGHLPIGCPPDYPDMQAFLTDLTCHLTPLHHQGRAPLVQSVRQGSQTAGRLFGRQDPVIQTAATALQEAATVWLQQLPDDADHPFLRRRRQGLHVVGSWSVRLAPGGHHANHIHGEGWLSSAFHVALPVQADDAAIHAGNLQFGQPMNGLGLPLAPERIVTPKAGWLTVFPSYFWHGTVPFQEGGTRLSIAFDAQPLNNPLP